VTDLELVRKCAKVAGIEIIAVEGDPDSAPYYHDRRYGVISYWPLTNKEQAMDLLCLLSRRNENQWCHIAGFYNVNDMCRAIVECAAATVED
jgi:hypothetical protein